jgi:hypothetical protein
VNLCSVIFWTLIVLLGLVVLVLFIIRNASQHRKGLAALAKELGFTYERESPELLEQFKDFRLFVPDRYRSYQLAWNVLKGKTGSATVCLFDYYYRIRSGSFQHNFTICALRSPDLKLPYFYLRHKFLTEMVNPFPVKKGVLPESHPTSMEFGGSEIDFPEDEKFTKKFVLQGKEEVVRPLFDVDLRQHLLPFGDIWHAPAREVEGNRDTLMLITTGPIDPKDARELIQQTTNLFTLLSQRTESW